MCSEFWWFSRIEKATCEVLAISAKRKSLLGSTSEEDYPTWERHILHHWCFRRERMGLCSGAVCEV